MRREVSPGWDGFADRKDARFTLFGRLQAGVTIEQAEAEMDVVYRAEMAKVIPLLGTSTEDVLTRFRARKLTLKPGPGPRGGLRDAYRKPLLLLMGLTLLVLLMSCVNVANLQLARGAVRVREVSARLGLGASRMQIVRQFFDRVLPACGRGRRVRGNRRSLDGPRDSRGHSPVEGFPELSYSDD